MNTCQAGGPTLTCIIGDNANLHAGVFTLDELDAIKADIAAEPVTCPDCDGCGDGAPFEGCPPCDWCFGSGFVTRATRDEWMEAQR